MDVAGAFRAHRVGVTGHAGLLGNLRSGYGQHWDPAEQEIRRLQPFARTYESAQRRRDRAKHTFAGRQVTQDLVDEAETAAAIVVGIALGLDRPARARCEMIAQIFTDPGQCLPNFYTEPLQQFRLTDAGQFEQLRRIDGTGADHDVASRFGLLGLTAN